MEHKMIDSVRGKKTRWIYSWKFTLPVLLMITLVYVLIVAPRFLERRVRRFCETVNIGSPQEVIIERANHFGLDIEFARLQERASQGNVLAIRIFPGLFLYRIGCTVKALNGKVVEKIID